ncbi:heme-binding protein [Aquipseudomonas alcaligenes]
MNALLRTQTHLGLALAMQALQAALDAAAEQGARVSIQVVDAAGFGIATHAWQERFEGCSAAVCQGLPLQPGMALFGGGEPFHHQGQVIGAIGISGASERLDGLCARAAVERVAELLAPG